MYCWRVHRKLRLTSFSVSWMRLHVLLVIQESSIADWGSLCMSTFSGSTCRNEWSSSSSSYRCITPFNHHKTPRYLTDWLIPISNVVSRRHRGWGLERGCASSPEFFFNFDLQMATFAAFWVLLLFSETGCFTHKKRHSIKYSTRPVCSI